MKKLSIVDSPISSFLKDDGTIVRRKDLNENNPDTLNTGVYAEALARFIRDCDTPLTIGVQGEWGSGKTSLLNMIKEDIEEELVSIGRGSRPVSGSEVYKTIWINTWEHSLLKSPEQCLLSIVHEIIDTIAKLDGSWNATEKAKSALNSLAKGAITVGVSSILGDKAGQITEDLLIGSSDNALKSLRSSLIKIAQTLVKRDQNNVRKFIVFIDDLDRLDPSVAVMILELLKNIFSIEYFVFVLAIDYQVVVKGLKSKFGEPTEQNEWEFRAFFDKIIQLPFMMPVATYDLDKYIMTLLGEITFFTISEKKILSDRRIEKMIRYSIGYNPRSLKRLLNALSLIKIQNEHNFNTSSSFSLKQLIIALVCFQISYPKLYELLILSPEFSQWDDEFVNRVTGGPHEENKEVAQALDRAMTVHEEDFDEEWEQALFKIVWLKHWQKSRLPEASKFLSVVKDVILMEVPESEHNAILRQSLLMTAVTAVASTDDGIFSRNADDNSSNELRQRVKYWNEFALAMSGSGSVFDPIKQDIRSTHSSGYLSRCHEDLYPEKFQFVVASQSTSPLRFETYAGDPDENHLIFKMLAKCKSRIEENGQGKIKVTIKVKENANKQSIIFNPPDINKRLTLWLPEFARERKEMFEWIRFAMPIIVPVLIDIINSTSEDE